MYVQIITKENLFVNTKTVSYTHLKCINLVANELPKGSVYKSVEWTSSNSNVSVNEEGVVTNKTGAANASQITCTVTNEKGETCSSSVWVTFVRYGVKAISFADEKVFGAPAQTVTLSPKFDIDGSISVIKDCFYSSDNEAVATVDQNGVVTFVTQGLSLIHI